MRRGLPTTMGRSEHCAQRGVPTMGRRGVCAEGTTHLRKRGVCAEGTTYPGIPWRYVPLYTPGYTMVGMYFSIHPGIPRWVYTLLYILHPTTPWVYCTHGACRYMDVGVMLRGDDALGSSKRNPLGERPLRVLKRLILS